MVIDRSTVKVKTAPTLRPIQTSDVRQWAKIPSSNDDTAVDLLIDVCVGRLEAYLDRKFISQTVEWFFDGHPHGHFLDLPIGDDVTSITTIKYYTTADVLTTFDGADYSLDNESIPNRALLLDTKSWPTDVRSFKSYVIEFVVGKTTAELVDNRIKAALMKMCASQVDEGRISSLIMDNSLLETAMAEVADLKTNWSF